MKLGGFIYPYKIISSTSLRMFFLHLNAKTIRLLFFYTVVTLLITEATLEIITKHLVGAFRALLNTKNVLVEDRMTFFKQ